MSKTALSLFILILEIQVALAQMPPPLSEQMRHWEQTPEDPTMKAVCINDLRYATEIANLRSHGATEVTMLKWMEQEAEKTAIENKSDPSLAEGTLMVLTDYNQRWSYDKEIYSTLSGGFVHWIYHSCLIGKPLYEK